MLGVSPHHCPCGSAWMTQIPFGYQLSSLPYTISPSPSTQRIIIYLWEAESLALTHYMCFQIHTLRQDFSLFLQDLYSWKAKLAREIC